MGEDQERARFCWLSELKQSRDTSEKGQSKCKEEGRAIGLGTG